jgi:MFS family permease
MRWRDFTLLWSASAASQLGGMCAATANPLLALVLTRSPVFAGYVGAASTIPTLLMHLPAGWFVDRFNRRLLMFAGQAGRLAGCGLVVYALWTRDYSKPLLITGALCEGMFLVLYSSAEITAVQRVVDPDMLSSALAVNEARRHLALITGKPLGGFLFGQGKIYPYLVNMLAGVWSLSALFMMDKTNYQPHGADGTADHPKRGISLFDGVKTVIGDPFLRTVTVVCAVGNYFFQTVMLLLIVLAQRQHMSSSRIGLLLATSGVGGLIGSIVAPKLGKCIGRHNIVWICVLAWTALTFVVAVSAHPVIGLIAWGGLSVTGGLLNVALVTYQTKQVDEHLLGRVMGINRFLTSGAVPLGALSAGYIVAVLQPRAAAWLAFAAIALTVVAVPFLLRGAAEESPGQIRVPATVRRRCASSDLDGFAAVRATWSRGDHEPRGDRGDPHAQILRRMDTERTVLAVPLRYRRVRASIADRPRTPQDPYGALRRAAQEL